MFSKHHKVQNIYTIFQYFFSNQTAYILERCLDGCWISYQTSSSEIIPQHGSFLCSCQISSWILTHTKHISCIIISRDLILHWKTHRFKWNFWNADMIHNIIIVFLFDIFNFNKIIFISIWYIIRFENIFHIIFGYQVITKS